MTEKEQTLYSLFGFAPHRVNYLINISEKNKYIYFETPKVACSTIKKTLQKMEVDDASNVPENVHDKEHSPLMSPLELKHDFTKYLKEDYFKFAFVRNPYTRILSCYLDKIQGQQKDLMLQQLGLLPTLNISFETFLIEVSKQNVNQMDVHWQPQHILLGAEQVELDFIGKQEHFAEDFNEVLSQIIQQDFSQPKIINERPHARGANEKLSAYLTPQAIGLINEIYDEDFKRYGYKKQQISIVADMSVEPSPLVSIVVPCYNQAHYLEETVQSAIDQSYKNIEIIIINDGSPDNTAEVASSLEQKYPQTIRILTQKNQGLAEARNNGIRIAKGKYILPLDSDDKLYEEMIFRCMNAMMTNEADIVYVDLQCFGMVHHIAKKKPFSENDILYENLPPPISLYKKQVWQTLNGYKHNMNIGYEDWEFWVNAYKHGFRFHYHPEALVYYRVKEESMVTNAYQKDAFLKAKIIMNHPELYPEEIRKYGIQTIKNEENKIRYYFYHDTNLEEHELLNRVSVYFTANSIPNGEILEMNHQKIALYPLDIIQNSATIPKLYINNHNLNGLCFFSVLYLETPHVKPCSLALDYNDKLVSIEGTIFPFVYSDILINTKLQQIALRRLHAFQTKQPAFQNTADLVSVAVPCYNQAQYLPDTIRSITEQTYKHIEIIIVNDGSTDNTLEVAEELTLRYLHCNIKIINQKNMGLSEARNSGIKAAKGFYILPLDADDKLHSTMINKCFYALRQNNVDIVYGNYQRFGEETTIQKTGEKVHLYFIQYANITGATALYKKSIWETLGGYKKNMSGGYEDWEFWVNAAKNDFKFHHISEVLFYYRVKKESMYMDAAKKHTYLCSKIVMNHPELYTDKEQHDAIVSIKQFEQTPELYFYFDKTIISNEKKLVETIGEYIKNNNSFGTLQSEKLYTIFSSEYFGTIALCNLKNSVSLDDIKKRKDVDCIIFYSELKHNTAGLSIGVSECSRFAWSKQKGCISSDGTLFPFFIDSDPLLRIEAYKRSAQYHCAQYQEISNVFGQCKTKCLDKNDIDHIRDGAIAIENKNIQLAYDLMSIAHNARPTGSFIKQKLDEYKSLLRYK